MNRVLAGCLATALLLLSVLASAQSARPRIEKEPAWITRNTVNYASTALDAEAEGGYKDLAYERQIHLGQQAAYVRRSLKVLTDAGVQNASEVSIDFDPAFQQLILHSVRILRGTESLNRLELAKAKTFQQETDISRHLYNGSLTTLLVLEDVRKGDVIEYSYTLKGFNPVFNNKYATTFDMEFGVPVNHLYYKLVAPAHRTLFIKTNETAIEPTVRQTPAEKTYEWALTNVPARNIEEGTPSWHDAYGTVTVSEFANWKEVSDWATTLFPFNTPLSPGLQQKIEEIKKAHATPEARTVAALQFVQDEVRYMGIEMGTNSHKPHHPNKVFAQRFGDCKDKSYLLCTMLRAMGIEAAPVLINTDYKKTITTWLAHATAFDHVTVQVKIAGATYWFDPTSSYQRGSIRDISYPDYQVGLVVSPANTGLTPIPLQDKAAADIKEVFTVTDYSGKATLEVTTTYTGSFADNARSSFESESRFSIQKQYRDFYAAWFENIKADSLAFADNEQTGAVTIREWYTVPGFWTKEKEKLVANFSPFVTGSVIKKLAGGERTHPFALTFPANYKEQIEIILPEKWKADAYDQTIQKPGFTYRCSYRCEGSRVVLDYQYETHKDHVAPGEAADYAAAWKEINDNSGYYVSYSEGSPGFGYTTTPSTAGTSENTFTLLYVLLGLCVLITALVRRNRKQNSW